MKLSAGKPAYSGKERDRATIPGREAFRGWKPQTIRRKLVGFFVLTVPVAGEVNQTFRMLALFMKKPNSERRG